jgi:hypothetical protein
MARLYEPSGAPKRICMSSELAQPWSSPHTVASVSEVPQSYGYCGRLGPDGSTRACPYPTLRQYGKVRELITLPVAFLMVTWKNCGNPRVRFLIGAAGVTWRIGVTPCGSRVTCVNVTVPSSLRTASISNAPPIAAM